MSFKKHFLFKLKALISIRKATSCKVAELLDAFVSNGLIEELVAILNHYGEATFKAIENLKHDERSAEQSSIREI
jgi:DNA-directed RNA polymerase alpha subunit